MHYTAYAFLAINIIIIIFYYFFYLFIFWILFIKQKYVTIVTIVHLDKCSCIGH